MRQMLFFLMVPFVCCGCLVGMSALVDEIVDLRSRQRNASVREYYDYENRIIERKQTVNGDARLEPLSFTKKIVRDVGHALPFIVWQGIVLVLLVVLALQRKFSFMLAILLGLVMVIVGLQYCERIQQWIIIDKDAHVLRLGPGNGYPVCLQLQALDEVRVLAWRGDWCKVTRDGIIGWLEDGAAHAHY